MIEEYDFGKIVIEGKEYTSDVILSQDGIDSWWRKTSHNVEPADIEKVVAKKPKLMIIGNGHEGCMKVPEETIDWIKDQGIEVSVELTKDAVNTYNKKAGEGVIGLLHLTC